MSVGPVTVRPLPRLGPPEVVWARPVVAERRDQAPLPGLGAAPVEVAGAGPTRGADPEPRRVLHDRLDGPVTMPADPAPAAAAASSAPASGSVLPDPERWSRWLVGLLVEVVEGRRPTSQLARWTDERVLSTVVLRTRQLRRERTRTPVPAARGPATVRTQRPRREVVEVSAVVGGRRPVAVALRLEATGDRWLCTALDFGPQTPQPG